MKGYPECIQPAEIWMSKAALSIRGQGVKP